MAVAVTAAEVAANFAASLDNNAPVASDGSHNLMEDACSKLPAFAIVSCSPGRPITV